MNLLAIVPESSLYITLRRLIGRQLLIKDLSLSPLGIKVMIPILSKGDKDGQSLLKLKFMALKIRKKHFAVVLSTLSDVANL